MDIVVLLRDTVRKKNYSSGSAGNRIIPFPAKLVNSAADQIKHIDPQITVLTESGRELEKLGMSGTECCYILLPDVHQVTFYFATDTDRGVLVRLEKVILSEPDAVTEIAMPSEDVSTSMQTDEMRWIKPGRTLALGRKSPQHVALLSLQLAQSEK
ncbi:hypothetical protein [Asaia prunellae]|uniref:hypothetical protein n=1 Tax=Asaia prunellae TaxID=610245 RepID=UPI0011DDCD8A|nr:hypothetical protein [Asaia prunellae]